MKEPSKAQSEAIYHVDGPAILVAGPGSGKTFTIVQRISYLIQKKGIPPDNILVVTFSKAAAKEMQSRFQNETNIYDCHFGTFHSIAYYILRTSFSFSNSSLITDNEKLKIISQVFKNHGFSNICNLEFLNDILDQLSKCKNSDSYQNLNLSFNSEEFSKEELIKITEEYQQFILQMGKLDFDDMILNCLSKLRKNREALTEYQNKFLYVLVDEFQDINKPQYDLIRLLSAPQNNLFVVGDDDQAIYRFRGSTPGVMKQFISDYPKAKTIFLTDNYRSGKNIVNFADNIISRSKSRYDKKFNPIKEGGIVSYKLFESRYCEEREIITILKGFKQNEQLNTAIIVRTNREVTLFSQALKKEGLNVRENVIKKKSIFQSFVMEDIKTFLQFIYEGRKRDKFLNIMNKPNRYFQRIAIVNETVNKEELIQFYMKNNEMMNTVEDYFKKIELSAKMPSYLAISIFRKSIGYDRYLNEISQNKEDFENLKLVADEIENVFKSYDKNISINEFIDEMNNRNVTDISKKTTVEGIHIITMHTAKGLEYDNVIVPDVNEGIIPSSRVSSEYIEEERRLLYVAVTRARNRLFIFSTNERNREISRFIKGLI